MVIRRLPTRFRVSHTPVIYLVLIGIVLIVALSMAHGRAGDVIRKVDVQANDPIANLQHRIDRGEVHLSYDSRHGWLESVLQALHIPTASQGLVFSKTSFQLTRISPRAPRAVYFNDNVYVGWVQNGAVLEIASVDPKNGTVFYSLPQRKSERPRFTRETDACLQCHQSQMTGDVPGLLMRSVYPDSDGIPILSAGTFATTERSPLKERWGGWYMDGTIHELGMGNGIASDPDHADQLTRSSESLSKQVDLDPYLTEHSDGVALLVLAHQTHFHNLLTRAAYETRNALRDEAAVRQVLHDLGPEHTEKRFGVHRPCPDLDIVGLLDYAASIAPILLQLKYQVLKRGAF